MPENFDVIVIGAGIVGACVTYEMTKGGKKVVCLDKNPVAGAGSTTNSCAVIRTHYSTLGGAAFALSNYPYWQDWARYLGATDDGNLAQYREVGCIYTCFKENNYAAKLVTL